MPGPIIENARIARAQLYLCDHGVWTSTLALEGPGWGQGFGGYNLQAGGSMFIWVRGVCQMLGVDEWSKVQGQIVRVRRTDETGCASRIIALGHIIEDRWFDFEAILREAAQSGGGR